MNKLELQKTANEIRKGIVTAVHSAKAGHPGGSLSATELFTYLYFEEMNIDPKEPKKADRDRFVLSKGHTAPGLYSTLAHRGYFPIEDLRKLVDKIQHLQCEMQTIELKAANKGCPTRLYNTLSSFSNQDEGGIIIFGLDEKHDYAAVGVYEIGRAHV